jgi:Tfp pilus assembly protein PilV
MEMRQRGLSIIEVIITIVVLLFGTFVIISTFSMNLRESSQSRERLMAALVMENLVEEVLAHPYGDPIPKSWQKREVGFTFIVEGHRQQSKFVRDVTESEDTGNGSFFGSSSTTGLNSDVVKLTVTWTEASGQGSSGRPKTLVLYLTVRREL